MTQNEMLVEIGKANEQVQRVMDWVKEHSAAFLPMNLKLYDAYYYDGSEKAKKEFPLTYAESYSEFEWFCNQQWEMFDDWLAENGIEWSGQNEIAHYIGRTSSFFLHDREIVDENRYYSINYDAILDNFLYYEWHCYTLPTKDGFVDTEINVEDYEECYAEYVDWIINSFFKEFTEKFDDTIKVYEYVHDTKENQVAYFKSYLEINEEVLQEQKDEDNRYEDERKSLLSKFTNEVVREIYERTGISNKDLKTLLAYA